MLKKGAIALVLALAIPAAAQAGQTIAGDNIEINYNDQGTWNWSTPAEGFLFRDTTTDPWIDFTYPGRAWQYISIEFNDSTGPQVHQVWEGGTTMTSVVRERDDSSGTYNVSYYQYAAGVLDIFKREVWEDSSRTLYVEFRVENTDTADVTDFRLMFAVDPDQGIDLGPGSYSTFNDTVDGDGDGFFEWVESAFLDGEVTLGFGTCDTADEVGHTLWDDDADAVLADDDGARADRQMHWRHRESTIASRTIAVFGFIVAVDMTTTDTYAEYTTASSTFCAGCDVDGDTVPGVHCGGTDCDDTDSTILPGAPELCDGVDNDCDTGTADGSDETWLGDACDGTDTDLCEEGTYSCTGGAQVCSDTTGDDLDVCDDADNDCDSTTPDGADETWYGVACDGSDTDLCEEGREDCVSGSRTCTDDTGDLVDVCDDKDNDCDTSTAEGLHLREQRADLRRRHGRHRGDLRRRGQRLRRRHGRGRRVRCRRGA
ncbi:MAG: putative metal-binding motif-containing protein [Deltaproteobacteria bacterium]|nr:putative metal-binding motif-containing protein [Deltaproteobacteria bacterium]